MAHAPRVLFATSNGTGLGHLNRAMAIARRLDPAADLGDRTRSGGSPGISLFTLSQAAPVVAGAGFEVEYLSSYRRPGSGTDRAWNLRLRDVFAELIAEREPEVVVFDGVHPYRAVTHVLSRKGAPPSIWCRRPMWRAGSSRAPLRRQGAFDVVLEPGELAFRSDRGPTREFRSGAVGVDPIVFLDRDELLGREEAAAELGLDPSRRTALVTLGQGGEVDRAVAKTLKAFTARGDIQVAALQSSIAPGLDVPDGVIHLRSTFPMSRYFRAFDMAVSASGYNGFHELIAFGVPTLFVPMVRNTDDQFARARWAAAEGVALAVNGAGDGELEKRVEELCDADRAAELTAGCERVFRRNGAEAAAELVTAVAAGTSRAPNVRETGRFNRWLRLSAHPVGPTLPLVLAMGARDLLKHPERRSPRLAILALGVPPEELEGRLREVIAGGDPARVLVLTDSLDFAMLRGLGVAFEHLPVPAVRPHERQIEQLRDRAAVLLNGRKPLRAASVGELGEALLGEGEEGGRA